MSDNTVNRVLAVLAPLPAPEELSALDARQFADLLRLLGRWRDLVDREMDRRVYGAMAERR